MDPLGRWVLFRPRSTSHGQGRAWGLLLVLPLNSLNSKPQFPQLSAHPDSLGWGKEATSFSMHLLYGSAMDWLTGPLGTRKERESYILT